MGTFKTREESPKAYHTAHVKFTGQDDQINFPVSNTEKLFLDSLTPEEVLCLMEDHNYDRELYRYSKYNVHHRHNQDIIPGGPMMVNIIPTLNIRKCANSEYSWMCQLWIYYMVEWEFQGKVIFTGSLRSWSSFIRHYPLEEWSKFNRVTNFHSVVKLHERNWLLIVIESTKFLLLVC